ncbi:MAG TPA: ribosomal protein L7/L12 [Ktedonobacteraceae bacterium]|nr:ribosomal protein L7/L12 [Ktedonobacteraceae bacterium]
MENFFGGLLAELFDIAFPFESDGTPKRLPPERFAALNERLASRAEIERLLSRNQEARAIRLFARETGANSREARMAVSQIAQELVDAQVAQLTAQMSERTDMQQLLSANKKIEAIKLFRTQTGTDLRTAKRAVERMLAGQRAETVLDLDASVANLLERRQKLQAIKLYRESTGVGLKEAKEAVEAIERTMGGPRNGVEGGLVDPDELQRLILAGKKIEAIKYYREQTGAGLREAKDAVDWLDDSLRSKK